VFYFLLANWVLCLQYPISTLEPNSSSIRLGSSNFVSRGDLRIKVALRTYRLFFVPNTEDSFCRKRSKEELEATAKQSEERRKERKERWEKWLEQKVGNTGTGSSTS
jgi:histone deacetylase complex regulatory component SIN3